MGADELNPELRLRVSRLQVPVLNLGPGQRVGLWLQGCTLDCPGCLSPTLQDPRGGRVVPVTDLADLVFRVRGDCEGLTVSGGEPFQQYAALLALCATVKAAGLHVLVYTGYGIEELFDRHPDAAFTSCVDLLIDGRYNQGFREDANWRGSANQRLFRFRDGQPVEVPEGFSTGPWSVSVPDGSRAFLSGVPKAGDLEALTRDLERAGLPLRFG